MKKMSFYLLWVALPLLSTLFQASTKMLAAELTDTPFRWSWVMRAAHSPWALVVMSSEVLSFILWLNVLTNVPLSKAFPITAVAYVSILLLSWTLFNEPVMLLQIVGSTLILAGVWFITTASHLPAPENR